MAHMAMVVEGVLRYLLLCMVSVAMGVGFLRLLRVQLTPQSLLTFAPAVTAACWAIALGIGVALRIPVRYLAGPLWGLTLGLSLYGLVWALARARFIPGPAAKDRLGFVATAVEKPAEVERRDRSHLFIKSWPIVICALLPLVVMFPYFKGGLTNYPGSTFPDGWSYAAYGQYLWEYPRGIEGGLAPLYQFGAHLSSTRFIASSLLGFFSPLFSVGATQMSGNLFLAWALFTFASSCAFFGLTQGLIPSRLLAYLILTVVSGWVYNLLWANNLDNAQALSYFPALVGAVSCMNPRTWSWRLILGVLAAGLLYCYPELALVILGGMLLVVFDRCWSERRTLMSWLLTVACAIGVMVALVAPFMPEMYGFVRGQVMVGLQSSKRPGEGLFNGLLFRVYQPAAFWGLGGEYRLESWLLTRNVVALLLSALAGFGILRLIRQRRFGFVALIVLLVVASGLFIVVQRYSYGAYKLILLAWWSLSFAVILGLDSLLRWRRTGVIRYVAVGLCSLIALLTLVFNHYAIAAPNAIESRYEQVDMAQFRELEQLKRVTGGASLLVVVDDWLANEWAVYYLRDTPIHLGEYRMYMAQPHVIPSMERAQLVPPEETRYILTDASFDGAGGSHQWKLVWSGGPYRLWDAEGDGWASITNITNGNGVERFEGERFFWIGNGDTTVDVLTSQAGLLYITATFLPGPSVPNLPQRTVLVTTSAGYREQIAIAGGVQSIKVPVPAGDTAVTLRPLDQPTRTVRPNGDTRPLVLGVKGIAVRLDTSPAALKLIQHASEGK